MVVPTVENCENCDEWFCHVCDEDFERCTRCGRVYCGDCWEQVMACVCLPTED